MGSVKRLEFDALPHKGGWDYIYLNDDIQGSKEAGEISGSSFNKLKERSNCILNMVSL